LYHNTKPLAVTSRSLPAYNSGSKEAIIYKDRGREGKKGRKMRNMYACRKYRQMSAEEREV
jgi:hypothetical protein